MIELDRVYLEKAEENLAAAQSEFINDRYNSSASRAYYACFQAAIFALSHAGIQPSGRTGEWGHDFVQAQFIGQLINRRKLYATDLRQSLLQNYRLRETADYKRERVNEIRADRAVRRAEDFVAAVREGGGRP
jgi:uncharacterized protein (UPF0332 family)